MIIDKGTGRGCALRISSKRIIGKLVAEGITGRSIYRIPRINRYAVLTVVVYGERLHVWPRSGAALADEPLWTPSFIAADIWERAVRRFRPCQLDRNVEDYLLPELEEYLQSIPDTELISMTRDFLIEHGVIDMPALLNTICALYPEYTAMHNAQEAEYENANIIKASPGAGTEFFRF